jgi:hypothetical protein
MFDAGKNMTMRELIRRSWPRLKLILTLQVVGSTTSALCVLCSGCATGYLADRVRDGADVFTLTMSAGLGARARVGPLHAGLNATVGDIGLRGGAIESDGAGPCVPLSSTELLCFGNEFFWPQRVYFGDRLRCQMKTYYTDDPYVPLFTPSLEVYDLKTDNKIGPSGNSV